MSRPIRIVSIIIAVVVVLAVGAYTVNARMANRSATPVETTATVSVKRGPIQATVSTSGNIIVPNQSQAKLSFDVTGGVSGSVSGRVSKLNVDVGSVVKKGDVLAELSSDSLQTQLRQQKASLLSAQAKLDALRAGSRAEDIATAESALRSAKIRVDALYKTARPEQIAAAKAQLEASKAKLDQILHPTATDIATAQGAVDTAQHNRDAAKTKLDQLLHSTAADVAAAQSAVASAANSLASARAQLDKLVDPLPVDLITARAAVQSAQSAVNAKKAALNSLVQRLNRTPTLEDITDAQNDAAGAATNLAAAQARLDQLQSPRQEDIDLAKSSVAAAQAAYDSAKAKLDQLQHPSAADIAIAEANVAIAQTALDSAKLKLDALKNPSAADIASAQAAIAQAEQTFASLNTPLDTDVQLQQEAIRQAEQALSLRKNPYTAYDIAQAQSAVEQAQAQVDSTQQQIDGSKIIAPFDGVVTAVNIQQGMGVSASAVVIQLSEVGKLQVNATVDEVDIAKVRPGQTATLSLDALPGIPVRARVGLISYLGTTQSGVVSYEVYLDILPTQQPSANAPQSGVAASPAPTPRAGGTRGAGRPIIPNGQTNINIFDLLHPGFTVLVNIIVDQRDNVLLVPIRAVRQSGQDRLVRVMVNGQPEDRKVRTGLSDSQNVEIVEGLQEGDTVVVQSPQRGASAPAQPTFGAGRGGFGTGAILGGPGGR